jgi:hypothetical protein
MKSTAWARYRPRIEPFEETLGCASGFDKFRSNPRLLETGTWVSGHSEARGINRVNDREIVTTSNRTLAARVLQLERSLQHSPALILLPRQVSS